MRSRLCKHAGCQNLAQGTHAWFCDDCQKLCTRCWARPRVPRWHKSCYCKKCITIGQHVWRKSHAALYRLQNDARTEINRQLAAGTIVKTACHCGNPKVQRYYTSLTPPHILWLCRKHHYEAQHAKQAETRAKAKSDRQAALALQAEDRARQAEALARESLQSRASAAVADRIQAGEFLTNST